MMQRALMWLNLYGREAVQHNLKNGLKTQKNAFFAFFCLANYSTAITVSIQLSSTPQLRTNYLGYPLLETSSCALAHMTFSCVQCRAFSYEQCTAYVYARCKEASACSVPKIRKKKHYYIYCLLQGFAAVVCLSPDQRVGICGGSP